MRPRGQYEDHPAGACVVSVLIACHLIPLQATRCSLRVTVYF